MQLVETDRVILIDLSPGTSRLGGGPGGGLGIPAERITIVIESTVTDLAGNPLDGEIADPRSPTFPSGDGPPGGAAVIQFEVLRGDVNGDGVVDVADRDRVLAALGTCTGDPGFDPRADLDGNGCVENADRGIVLASMGLVLSPRDGSAPVATVTPTGFIVDDLDQVRLDFSEPIEVNTLTAGNIIVTDSSGSRVFGNIAVSNNDRHVVFTPNRRWRYGTTYHYGVSTDVLSQTGSSLPQIFTDSFTTFSPQVLNSESFDTALDIALSNGLAILGGSIGLTLLDLTNLTAPELIEQNRFFSASRNFFTFRFRHLGPVQCFEFVDCEEFGRLP